MSTVIDSGSQTATPSTEHSISSAIGTDGTYVMIVDATNLPADGVLELRAKRKARAADSQAYAYSASFNGAAPGDPLKISIPVPCAASTSLQFTLKQVGGTGAAFPWSIEKL
ncbi:MAG: hypothetical protein V4508_02260 [Pseudomonadota bacterium]